MTRKNQSVPDVTSKSPVASQVITNSSGEPMTVKCGPHDYQVGLYGWRRRCLYSLVLMLLVVVIVNLALTLFIFRVLDFSVDGMGELQIVNGGIVTNGNVYIMDTLVASHVSSRSKTPIKIFGSNNITLGATNEKGLLKSKMYLDKDNFECQMDKIVIKDSRQKILFAASRDGVQVGVETLKITGEGGAVLSGSLQTNHVTAPIGKSLLLESATRNLEVAAPQGITLESRAGAIKSECLGDFNLHSTRGAIKFDTSQMFVKGLPISNIERADAEDILPNVYQVCVCSSGRIFLAAPGAVCVANQELCG